MHSFTVLVALFFALPLVFAAQQTIDVAGMFSLTFQGGADSAGVSRQTAFIAAVQDINANPKYASNFTTVTYLHDLR